MAHIYPCSGIFTHDLPALRKSTVEYFHRSGRKSYRRFWLERLAAERSKAALVEAGATALTTQPPAEACEFTWDGIDFSTAYFDRQPDGSFSQPQGRWSDWLFPPGSFGHEPTDPVADGAAASKPVEIEIPLGGSQRTRRLTWGAVMV